MAPKLLKGLRTQFRTREGPVQAVNGVSFDIDEGEAIGIVGESGSGKSVTALSILRLLPMPPAQIVDGSVLFQDQDLVDLNEAEMRSIRGGQISMIFQDPISSLNPVMRIQEQIIEPLQLHLGLNRAQAIERARSLMEAVGIPDAARRMMGYPHQFSGGMRQRVMIAIAISTTRAISPSGRRPRSSSRTRVIRIRWACSARPRDSTPSAAASSSRFLAHHRICCIRRRAARSSRGARSELTRAQPTHPTARSAGITWPRAGWM